MMDFTVLLDRANEDLPLSFYCESGKVGVCGGTPIPTGYQPLDGSVFPRKKHMQAFVRWGPPSLSLSAKLSHLIPAAASEDPALTHLVSCAFTCPATSHLTCRVPTALTHPSSCHAPSAPTAFSSLSCFCLNRRHSRPSPRCSSPSVPANHTGPRGTDHK